MNPLGAPIGRATSPVEVTLTGPGDGVRDWLHVADAVITRLDLGAWHVTDSSWSRSDGAWPEDGAVLVTGRVTWKSRSGIALTIELTEAHGVVLATFNLLLRADRPERSDRPPLDAGNSLRLQLPIVERMLTRHIVGGADVLATPVLIGMMETTCADLALSALGRETPTVGSLIDVRHTAPAYQGELVDVEAVFRLRRGRQLLFDVTAAVESRVIGVGRIGQHVIPADAPGRGGAGASPVRWMDEQLADADIAVLGATVVPAAEPG